MYKVAFSAVHVSGTKTSTVICYGEGMEFNISFNPLIPYFKSQDDMKMLK